MATVLTEIADTAEHPGFIRRVGSAIIKAAVAIGNEPYDGSQYTIMRRSLANKVFEFPDEWADRFAWPVARGPLITVDSSDNDIEWTVAEVWDAVAGAFQPVPEPAAEPAPEPEPEPEPEPKTEAAPS